MIRNGKLAKESFIRPCGGGQDCNFPTPIKIPPDHWFMMGDNRGSSDDSRFWGPVPKKWIIGGAFATYWPPAASASSSGPERWCMMRRSPDDRPEPARPRGSRPRRRRRSPQPPEVGPAPASARPPPRRRRSGRRLVAFDRALGARFVAGADEAGRGCLAGPLVAAAVLFDYERIGLREVRALSALNDSKQHTPEAREALYPVVLRTAARVAVVSRCVRGIDGRGLHVTNLAALRDALVRWRGPAACASPTASRSATSATSSGR